MKSVRLVPALPRTHMKISKMIVAFAIAALACGAFAQRGQGRGFGRGFGGVSVSNPTQLLSRADVQADLNLTDDQKVKLEDIQQKMRALFPRGGRRGGG